MYHGFISLLVKIHSLNLNLETASVVYDQRYKELKASCFLSMSPHVQLKDDQRTNMLQYFPEVMSSTFDLSNLGYTDVISWYHDVSLYQW